MSPTLKHVDPKRPRGPLKRAYAALANTRFGRFFSIHVLWKLDPLMMRATGGRLGSGLGLIPTGLLETRGAKSGAARRNTVIYFHDGERVTVVASKLGMAKHPAWFHNLVANPDVVFGGAPMRATVVADEAERERIWALADRVFPLYATYRREAAAVNRTIPLVQLIAAEPDADIVAAGEERSSIGPSSR